MIQFSRGKAIAILASCVLAVLVALPNLFPKSVVEGLPGWLPTRQMNLGLDLQGGTYLLFQVELETVIHDRLNGLADALRGELAREGVGFTNVSLEGDRIRVALAPDGDVAKARSAAAQTDADLVIEGTDGGILVGKSPVGLQTWRDGAMRQSIEIIRRRVDETGTREPAIQQQGADRILVQLPGVRDPERVKALIGTTAKLAFRMVDTEASQPDLERGRVPPGVELLIEQDRTATGQPRKLPVFKRVMVSGENLEDAQVGYDQNGQPVINFRFDTAGGKRFGDATKENVGKPFAIVLDNKVLSAPVIREPILGGRGQISGSFTVQSASDLALLLRAGALPAPLTVVEERTVGPDLGADSIHAGTLASIVATVGVVVFMMLLYGLFGLFANIALLFNLVMMIAALTLLQATLTLPGIAGIALTLGMAVDANVLIYERIREERRAGRSMINAIDAGFKRAFMTIIDSHVTTLIAGVLLFFLGSGPVKGFAVTLSIGVLTSLYTALLITQLLVAWWYRRYRPKVLPVEAEAKGLFVRPWLLITKFPTVDIVGLRRLGFAVAAVLTIGSVVVYGARGLNFGIDFSGGVLIEARGKTEAPVDLARLRDQLNGLGLGEVALQQFGSPRDVLIRVPHQPDAEAGQLRAVTAVRGALGEAIEVRRVEVVGPKVGGELIRASVIATLLALFAIAAYVAFRFEWQFGVCAMVGIAHGAITTIGVFALTQLEFNLTTLAAILTVAGYSINDTVVVFDRIRENIRKYRTMELGQLINLSLNETFSRTTLTAGSVVLAVLALLVFGGEALRGLSIAMLWGVVIGTLSSLFLSAPLLLTVEPRRQAKVEAPVAARAAAQR